MKNNTICILGGTGFVGRHVMHRLTRHGYRVTVLTRRPERHRSLTVNHDVRLVEADIFDMQVLQHAFQETAAVINLVGILNETGSRENSFERLHAELPKQVAAAASECGVDRLLHMSALHADSNEQHSQYLKTKGDGEDHAHAAASRGLAVTSFRPSVIFGSGDSFFNRFATLLKLAPGVFPLACPNSRFAPVYVGDIAEAICRTLEEQTLIGERLELCGPETWTLKELVEYTRDTLGLKHSIIGLGDGLSKLQARMLGLVPGKPFSMDNYYSLQHDSVCGRNALPDLGIKPTPVSAVVPGYLAAGTMRGQYNHFRQHSKRS
ncbi:MAG: complex I NDUFA9 subunit family protein [Gammaproteobacteria bacterium]|nr:MAG: complex I NDUFA9 subunit family protein [Gammaproteobacteria bacterium]